MNQNNSIKKEDHELIQKETAARPKKGMNDFRKALLWTTILTILLNFVALVGGIIAAIIFNDKGQKEISKGIWTGMAIGISIVIVGLGITCFVIMSSI
jgi:ABC-type sugar transport system permease subunit